jgi:hypothetical protein
LQINIQFSKTENNRVGCVWFVMLFSNFFQHWKYQIK